MRILVIGGMQFMGRRVVELLVERGDEVTVMHRGASHDLGSKVQNLQADRGELQAVARALEAGRFDVIVDTAYDWQHGTPASHVEAAARHAGDRLHRYVFMSSAAAYVPGLGLNEKSPLVTDDEPNPYAVHKASAERLLFAMHRESGFPAVTFRPPSCTGRGSPSIASSSSGIGCSTGGRSSCPMGATRRRSGCSSKTSPGLACARLTSPRRSGRPSVSGTSSR